MKNYVSKGHAITVVAASAIASGGGVLMGSLFGVAQADAANGDEVVLVTEGVFDLPKVSSQDWAVGAKVYWDAGNSRCTTVATANTEIGVAVAPAGNPSLEGRVRLGVTA